MTIYSPIPVEVIFQNQDQCDYKIVNQVIDGVPVQIMVTGNGSARIERILSTDPQDYLKGTLQPGQEILY